MENSNLIRLTDISFRYSGYARLFDSLNFNLKKGDRVGITGPNGSGKTTLFNLIMGFARPVSGTLEIFDRVRRHEKDFHEVRRRIGFLFQNSDDQLFCPSVREEIAFGPLNYRLPRSDVEKRVKESLSQVGLAGFEERAPYYLSEGEKRRLAIAAVLSLRPEIMLLDEPTNGIDEEGVRMIEDILKADSFSYIVISQDREFLRRTTDTLYRIKNGRMEREEYIPLF